MAELLERAFSLRCAPAHAFSVFTGKTDLWWPRAHRRTPGARMVFDPGAGGELVEQAPDGSRWRLGRVTAWEPPTRLCFDWFPGSPAAPTAVEIRFIDESGGTRIAITHTALTAEAIAAWPGKVALFERGWDSVIPALADHIRSGSEE